jgi:hypothetical protein
MLKEQPTPTELLEFENAFKGEGDFLIDKRET